MFVRCLNVSGKYVTLSFPKFSPIKTPSSVPPTVSFHFLDYDSRKILADINMFLDESADASAVPGFERAEVAADILKRSVDCCEC